MKRMGVIAALALVTVAAAAAATFNGTIEATDPTQTGRLLRNGVASTCAAPKVSPGLAETTGDRHYDSVTFVNTTGSPQCITVTLTRTSAAGGGLFAVAYLGSFNPADPGANYLADPGLSTVLEPTRTFSFILAAGATAVIVVHELDAGGCIGCTWTLDITSAPLAARLRSASATTTGTGVTLRWRTASEQAMLGFNVFRLRAGKYVRLNRSLVSARGSAAGAAYRYLDRAAPRRGALRYRLQAVELDGKRSWLSSTLTVRR